MTAVQEISAHPIRVMLAKIGLDGHDRGVKVVARTLRDAGMEVIYTGLHRSPEQVVEAAVQEDVDVLGVSLLSGAHMPIFTRIFQLLAALPETHRFAVVAGGVMPDEDEAKLKEMGVADVLGQDTTPETIVDKVRSLANAQASQVRGG
jgi:methylmalonyl-CoA mutase C-terminal domain/subunit